MADRKISDLTALTTPASGDYLPIVDISEAAAASKNKRITIEELFRGVPLGTAAAPSIAIEGDENTGIYSPGADQLAISTNGIGRLFVDASGNINVDAGTFYVDAVNNVVGLGSTNPSIYGSNALLVNNNTLTINQDGANEPILQFRSGTATQLGRIQYPPSGLRFVNVSGAAETVRITSDGKLGLGTSSPSDLLHISKSGGAAFFRTTRTDASTFFTIDHDAAYTNFNTSSRYLFKLNGTEAFRINENGRVGIGTTSPGNTLDVNFNHSNTSVSSPLNAALRLQNFNAGADNYFTALAFTTSTTSVGTDSMIASFSESAGNSALAFFTDKANVLTEKARIDSSGRLLVGTSSSSSASTIICQGNSAGSTAGGVIRVCLGNSTPANGNDLGYVMFADSSHVNAATITAQRDGGTWTSGSSQPTRLVFSTTPDASATPAEVMRITSDKYVRLASGTGGIQFNGDTAAANALDDYEEGTWTPAVINSSDTDISADFAVKTGSYTKIGNCVNFSAVLYTGSSAGTRTIKKITGLPFTIPNENAKQYAVSLGNGGGGTTADTTALPYIEKNTTEIRIKNPFTIDYFQSLIMFSGHFNV
jgi:hypothetical protein